MRDEPTRRTVLRYGGAAVAGVGLAGCSTETQSSSSGGSTDSAGSSEGTATPTETSGDSGGDSGGEWSETSTVEMTDKLTYAPKKIRVSAGTTVTWENTGNIGHTVTAYEDEIPDGATYFASGGFDSLQAAKDGYSDGEGNIPAGESYEHTFETKGTYKYYCIPHEMNGMVGYVEVV